MNHPSNPIYRLPEECSLANFCCHRKAGRFRKIPGAIRIGGLWLIPMPTQWLVKCTSNGRIARLLLSRAWFCSGSQSGLEGTVTLFVLLEQELERLLTYDLAGNPDVQFMRLLPVCCFWLLFPDRKVQKTCCTRPNTEVWLHHNNNVIFSPWLTTLPRMTGQVNPSFWKVWRQRFRASNREDDLFPHKLCWWNLRYAPFWNHSFICTALLRNERALFILFEGKGSRIDVILRDLKIASTLLCRAQGYLQDAGLTWFVTTGQAADRRVWNRGGACAKGICFFSWAV